MNNSLPDAVVTVPLELVWRGTEPLVTFGEVLVSNLGAPFWEDAVRAPHRVVALRPLDSFDSGDVDRVAGAVHHMTRCGSTLVMRQFSRVSGVMALSEPPIFAQLLDGPETAPDVVARRLRALLAAHCDGLRPVAERIVLKWPALATHHAAAIATALPEIPTVYLHRDPVEILASIEREALGGDNAIRPAHIGAGAAAAADPLERAALMIAQGCRALATTHGIGSLDYADLPEATIDRIARFFSIVPSAAERAAMQDAARTHSKDATDRQLFVDDRGSKRQASSPAGRHYAATIVAPALRSALRTMRPL